MSTATLTPRKPTRRTAKRITRMEIRNEADEPCSLADFSLPERLIACPYWDAPASVQDAAFMLSEPPEFVTVIPHAMFVRNFRLVPEGTVAMAMLADAVICFE